MWLQYDWAVGPVINLRPTNLFCAWLAWSRYRVLLPTWDRTLGTVLACVDNTLRRLGGAPTYLLTDNERTLTTDRIAGVPVRHPALQLEAWEGVEPVRVPLPPRPESPAHQRRPGKPQAQQALPSRHQLPMPSSRYIPLCLVWSRQAVGLPGSGV